MAKTIDDLEKLLTNNGYSCKRVLDVLVGTRVETKTYKSPAGENTLEIVVSFERPNDCVAVEILRAFDLRQADHKEATLACLLTASAHTPLLRTSLDPSDGEIRLRVDCPCGPDGARDEDVLRAVALLPTFADAWYPEIDAAMQKGTFDPNKVRSLELPRFPKKPPSTSEAPRAKGSSGDSASLFDAVTRAKAIARKPGGHPNRLKALFEFHTWLDGKRASPGDLN